MIFQFLKGTPVSEIPNISSGGRVKYLPRGRHNVSVEGGPHLLIQFTAQCTRVKIDRQQIFTGPLFLGIVTAGLRRWSGHVDVTAVTG